MGKNNPFKQKFMELMKQPTMQLPKRISDSYLTDLAKHFDEYQQSIEFAVSGIKKEVGFICDSLLKVAKISNPSLASEAFEALMNQSVLLNNLTFFEHALPLEGSAKKYAYLFRVREVTANKEYQIDDIFHAPVSMRQYVKASRYNESGSPQLYLSSDVKLCCDEIGKTEHDNLIGSLYQLRSNQNLKVLDLGVRPIDFTKATKEDKIQGRFTYDLSKYLIVYPLIAACSYVAQFKDNAQPEEYRISHALASWIMKHYDQHVVGIRYFSCLTSKYSRKLKNRLLLEEKSTISFTKYYINYVFFLEKELEKEPSKKLKEAFLITPPLHLQDFKDIAYFASEIKAEFYKMNQLNNKTNENS